jgi:hypothetical protein
MHALFILLAISSFIVAIALWWLTDIVIKHGEFKEDRHRRYFMRLTSFLTGFTVAITTSYALQCMLLFLRQ